jgi:hypothetical protein
MTKQKSVFIICSVRDADSSTRKRLEAYKRYLEFQGYKVHLPHLDTNQQATGYAICLQNMKAILEADEIHIFFVPTSYGSHFDLGVAFSACYADPQKIIKIIEDGEIIDEHDQLKLVFEEPSVEEIFQKKSSLQNPSTKKSFNKMIYEWQDKKILAA